MNDHPMMSGLSLTFFASLNSPPPFPPYHIFCLSFPFCYGIIFEKVSRVIRPRSERKEKEKKKLDVGLTAATLVL
jgi:hypothetical protein